MTDRVKAAVSELSRTIREIRESGGPAVVRRQEGDFFTFSTPGASASRARDTKTPPRAVSQVGEQE